jgi:hypothetical protein
MVVKRCGKKNLPIWKILSIRIRHSGSGVQARSREWRKTNLSAKKTSVNRQSAFLGDGNGPGRSAGVSVPRVSDWGRVRGTIWRGGEDPAGWRAGQGARQQDGLMSRESCAGVGGGDEGGAPAVAASGVTGRLGSKGGAGLGWMLRGRFRHPSRCGHEGLWGVPMEGGVEWPKSKATTSPFIPSPQGRTPQGTRLGDKGPPWGRRRWCPAFSACVEPPGGSRPYAWSMSSSGLVGAGRWPWKGKGVPNCADPNGMRCEGLGTMGTGFGGYVVDGGVAGSAKRHGGREGRWRSEFPF